MNNFYSEEELLTLGLGSVGRHVLISKKCSLYSPQNISIGDNVRIDDFCVLSGKIMLGNYIHIAPYCGLFGGEAGIIMADYSAISSKGTIYAISDDYSGNYMTNPMISELYRNVIGGEVRIGRHVVIGTNTTILPGVTIGEGCAVGAFSLILKDCKKWGIYAGTPAVRLKERTQSLLELEKKMQSKLKIGEESSGSALAFKDPIHITKAFLPPIEQYEEKIKPIWENHILTNNGPIHNQFEEELRKYLKVKNSVLFANGHLALDIAIKALGLQGEVITTPFTFASTTHAIVMNGLVPVFCDINKTNFTIDVTQLEKLITERTSAIIPVHVFGYPCDVCTIEKIADKYRLKVIYDAAHVFGTEVEGKGIGSFGDIAMFSLHATKVFHSIEGGVLTFRDEKLKEKLRLYKNFGIAGTESVEIVGMNAKMNEFQAAMGLTNLQYLPKEIENRKKICELYRHEFDQVEGISFLQDTPHVKHNYSYFPIIVDEKKTHITRNELYDKLKQYNVFTRKYFYPLITDFKCYKNIYESSHIINAKYIAERVLTLPAYGELQQEEVLKIVKIIKWIINEASC